MVSLAFALPIHFNVNPREPAMTKKHYPLSLLATLSVAGLFFASAEGCELSWQNDAGADVAGYMVYAGKAPGVYSDTLDVGNVLQYNVDALKLSGTVYFSVTAYDSCFNESEFGPILTHVCSDGAPVSAADVTPPSPVSAEMIGNDLLLITFNEQVERISATTSSNYAIEGVLILAASIDKSENKVFLATSPQNPGDHALRVSGVKDKAVVPNVMAADATIRYRSSVETGVGQAGLSAPARFSLEQNFPNPFNPETTIRFSVEEAGRSQVAVYNSTGQRVRILFDRDVRQPGAQPDLAWNATDDSGNPVSSGVYLLRLSQGNRVETRRMQVVR
jgi:hypothetical protein